MTAYVTARHAGGIVRADHGADRGAGDRGRTYAQLVEHFEHRDMGDAAGAAAAERDR